MVAAVVIGAGGGAVRAQDAGELTFRGEINGVGLDEIDANDPLRLVPGDETVVAVTVNNATNDEVFVRNVRFDGVVLGLSFFTYSTRIDLVVAPGDSAEREFVIDLGDLGGQVTGLVPGRLSLLDGDRSTVATRSSPSTSGDRWLRCTACSAWPSPGSRHCCWRRP